MVWTAGMDSWRPYGQALGAGQQVEVAQGDEVVCGACGMAVARSDAILYDRLWVCAACKPGFVQRLKENAEPTALLRYAGFWIRAGAWFIDYIVAAVVSYAFIIPLNFTSFSGGSPDANPAAFVGKMVLFYLVPTMLIALYVTLMVGKFGATLGKMACGLQIVMPDGSPVSYGRACGRHFATMLSSMLMYFGYLMVAFDKEERRALHDRICNTRVIRVRG
jgi:uncharacterized RDD family membrane protein YckC